MEWEDVEKAEVENLTSGVQGTGMRGGKAEDLEKRGLNKEMEEKSRPAPARDEGYWPIGRCWEGNARRK